MPPDALRYDQERRPVDLFGRVVPHPLTALSFALVPGFLEQFKKIPGEFWAQDVTDAGVQLAVVSCPCGSQPEIELAQLTECECHRFFMFTGRDVMAANRPKQYGSDEPVDPGDD